MKILLAAALLPMLAFPVAAQAKHAKVAQALQSDLQAIPANSPPTDAQIQTLRTDLGKLFRNGGVPPTLTLDTLAGELVVAASQGQFAAGDFEIMAWDITTILNGNTRLGTQVQTALASIETILTKAGVASGDLQQIIGALRGLPSAFQDDTYLNYLQSHFEALTPAAKGYKHLSGMVTFSNFQGPVTVGNVVTHPDQTTQALGLLLTRIPFGKYQLSVTTSQSDQPVEIGKFRVDSSDLVPEFDLSPKLIVSATVGFGDAPAKKPLPVGLSLADVTSVTITDDRGVQRLTSNVSGSDYFGTTRERRFHLEPGATAPTAGGILIATSFHNVQSPSQSLKLAAVNLPASATLTLSVNDSPVAQVTTGSTGNLFISSYGEASDFDFANTPLREDPINKFPDTGDLYTAKSYTVSDAQGNVLLTASSEQ